MKSPALQAFARTNTRLLLPALLLGLTTIGHSPFGLALSLQHIPAGSAAPLAPAAPAKLATASPRVLKLPGEVGFSPDGRFLIGFQEDTVLIWSRDGSRVLQRLKMPNHISDVQFTPDGRFLAAGASMGHYALWRTSDFRKLAEIHNPGHWMGESFALSPDGIYLSIIKRESRDGRFNVHLEGWDLRGRRRIERLPVISVEDVYVGHPPSVSVAFHPLGGYLSIAFERGTLSPNQVMVRDLLGRRWLRPLSGFLPLAYSLDGQYVTYGSMTGQQEALQLRHLPSQRQTSLRPMVEEGSLIYIQAAISSHGRYVAQFGPETNDQHDLEVIEARSGRVVLHARLSDVADTVRFSPDERELLVSTGYGSGFDPLLYRLP